MAVRLLKPLFLASLAFAVGTGGAGCATSGGTEPTLTQATAIPSRAASDRIEIGKSTKADVMAALGKTTAITFDSGFEVWVYHIASASEGRGEPGKTEFVVLFAPSGVVTKARVRAAPAPGGDLG